MQVDKELDSRKNGYMKTTVEVPDELMIQVKIEAALRRQKLKDLIPELLRIGLAAERQKQQPRDEFTEADMDAWLGRMREIGAEIQRKSVDPRNMVQILHDDRR